MDNNKVLNAPFIQEMIDITANMYRLGWDERNGGNISYLLEETEVSKFVNIENILREISIEFDARELEGKYFLVTGSGKYFRNIIKSPQDNLGLIRVAYGGKKLELLWGFNNNAAPTSELPSHFMSHIARLKVDPQNKVIMHCHASHLLSMTFTHTLNEKDFTRTIWQMCTESLVVLPDGISIIPWMVPGTKEIGEATARKMKETRLVIWPQHGVYGAGKDIDEAFGLIETAEKAAEVYTYVNAQGKIIQSITDENLKKLAEEFNVKPREGYLF